MASNFIFSWTALATLFPSNGSETRGIAVTPGYRGHFSHWGSCKLFSSCRIASTKMFTFHTYVFVSPRLRFVLGESYGLSNGDDMPLPPARHGNNLSKGIIYCSLQIKWMAMVLIDQDQTCSVSHSAIPTAKCAHSLRNMGDVSSDSVPSSLRMLLFNSVPHGTDNWNITVVYFLQSSKVSRDKPSFALTEAWEQTLAYR